MVVSEEELYTQIVEAYKAMQGQDREKFDQWRGKFYIDLMERYRASGDRLRRVVTNSLLVVEGLGKDPEAYGVDLEDLDMEDQEEILDILREFVE